MTDSFGGQESPTGPEGAPAGGPPDDQTATDLGGAPAGGSADGGQRPAGSTSGPAADHAGDAAEEDGADAEQAPDDADPLALAAKERDEYRDALIRLQADFENFKKRMMKQQTEHLERAAASLVDKLLPVLDTADLALAHGGGEDVKQITGSLMGALEKEGLERIAGEGAPFDPTLHDAVVHEPGEADGEQTVVEVLRAGYRWKGRVLRPAMVKVRG